MKQTVRCPYCVLSIGFRPMIGHLDGRYICDKCGHTARPGDTGLRVPLRQMLKDSRSNCELSFPSGRNVRKECQNSTLCAGDGSRSVGFEQSGSSFCTWLTLALTG